MMKSRGITQFKGGRKSSWLKAPTDGLLPYWNMQGYVQCVTENEKYGFDYVRFCIYADKDAEHYEVFTVEVPHSLDVVLEVGDHVYMEGSITMVPGYNEGDRKVLVLKATVVEEAHEDLKEVKHNG